MGGRRKRSIINTAVALLSELLVIGVGMFFPRVLISCYGSVTNGLISSLQQFAQYFTLISMGFSGAIVFALYSPLAREDKDEVERIVASAGKAFSKMGFWYTVALVGFGVVYPLLAADTSYSYFEVLLMFIAIGLNGASQLFYSGKYKALLTASQKSGTVTLINAIFTAGFSGLLIVFALTGMPAVTAVLLASLAYIARAAAYGITAKRYFGGYDFSPKGEAYRFSQQREVMLQQIFTLIVLNIPVIAMTVLGTDMTEISVFSVYNLVLSAVFTVSGAVNTGVSAGFGDLITRNDPERLRHVYREYEMIFHMFWTVMTGCMLALFEPFIAIYSSGVTDADYNRPLLCILFAVLGGLWMIRQQLATIIAAAGKFREIQCHSIIETVLSVVLSFAGLIFFGLEGMIAGRIIVTAFRVVSFAHFNCKYIVGGEHFYTWLHIGVSAAAVAASYAGVRFIYRYWMPENFLSWALAAAALAAVTGTLAVCAEFIINRKGAAAFFGKFTRKLKRGK